MTSEAIPEGRPGNLSSSQSQALAEVKKALVADGVYEETALPEDRYLCRFLRARDWNVKKATAMLKKCKEWRAEVGVDRIWDEWSMPFEEKKSIIAAWPQYFHKTDKSGRPLYCQKSSIDPASLFKAASQERLLENFIADFEGVIVSRYPACSEATGDYVDSSFLLMDMEGLSLTAFWQVRALFAKIIGFSQDYFPETSGKIRIINNGMAFNVAYAALKPFIDPRTVAKIKFLGYDYKEALLSEVDAENLPKEYGGTCECAEGCMFSNAGPWGPVPPNHAPDGGRMAGINGIEEGKQVEVS